MRKRKKGICLLAVGILLLCLWGCENSDSPKGQEAAVQEAAERKTTEQENSEQGDTGQGTARQGSIIWKEMEPEYSLELHYADQFSVDYYAGGYALITITDGGRFLLVPEEEEVPEGLEEDITVLNQPLDHIYLVATSAMDLFRELSAIEHVRLSGTDSPGWYIEEAKQAMENGDMVYAGKYNAPDYERILSEECDLAVESTMIYHSPEVKEQLENFGIPVLVERSSYESHPLGRAEWLKLYGALLGKEQLAEESFQAMEDALTEVFSKENTEKTVAFFHINSNGIVNVRKSGDYVAKMIELAGGRYIFSDLGDENALSTMNMQMESFYAQAKDADYLIYNSTIDGELRTLDELLAKNELLGDFKAVKEGNVWCTQKNLFQESTGIGDLILDIHRMLTDENEDLVKLTYLNRLQ